MTLRIGAKGELAVAAGKARVPFPRVPHRWSPAATRRPSSRRRSHRRSQPRRVPSPVLFRAPQAADLGGDPLVLRALAQGLNALESNGFDGGALSDIGLKNGSLVVQNEATGRQITFDNMSIRLGRTAEGGRPSPSPRSSHTGSPRWSPPSRRRATASGRSISS